MKNKFQAMGTVLSVEIISDRENISELEGKVKKIFTDNEKIFSRFRGDSELSKINSNVGKEIPVSKRMFEVLELCLKFNKISQGYFDPRIIGNLEKIGYKEDFSKNKSQEASLSDISFEKLDSNLEDELILNREKQTVLTKRRIDTTGIAKGYTVDESAKYLMEQGTENFIIDAGGDMYACGKNGEGSEWRVGVEGMEEAKLMLKLKNEGIATSGISRKKWFLGDKKVHHLINPKDPSRFSFDIKTVTVINGKTVEADGRAKVLVLMGKEKGLQFSNENGIKSLFLDYKGNVYLSEAIKDNVIIL